MITIPVLMVLLFALWTVALLVLTVGIYRWGSIFAGKAQLTDFKADDVRGSDFYKRAMRAHANCIENLPVFMAVVFAGHAAGVTSEYIAILSVIVMVARVLQSLVHVGFRQTNPMVLVRFIFFFSQVLCFFGIGAIIVNAVI